MRSESYARRVGWAANARQAGLRWRSYAELFAGAALVVIFLALWPHLPIRDALIGGTIGAVVAAVSLSLARFDDPIIRGELAERWSAETLGKVRGWLVTSNLSFADGDLDHLVVTPCGLLAVETKYRFRQHDPQRRTEQRYRGLRAAQRAARKAASLLRSKQVNERAAVLPVLIVWGAGKPELPDGYRVVADEGGDVYVLDGMQPALWTRLFAAPTLPAETRAKIHEALTRFQRQQIHAATGSRQPMRAGGHLV